MFGKGEPSGSYRPSIVLHTRGPAPVDVLVEQARGLIAAVDVDPPTVYATSPAYQAGWALIFFRFMAAGLALAIVLGSAVVATVIPAWRAARRNPLSALRGSTFPFARRGSACGSPKRRGSALTWPGMWTKQLAKNVTQFKLGDDVYGACRGALAEYASAKEDPERAAQVYLLDRSRSAASIALLMAALVVSGCASRGRAPDPSPPSAATIATREGFATYYGRAFHGRTTASGVPFDMNAMVAAHPTYPFGTIVRVTNLGNGRSVQVRVVDRGPANGPRAAGVIIDLSQAAAEALDFIREGRTRVRLEILQ